MLEIPESNTLAQQLNQTIKGKTIENVTANSSPHGFAFYYGNPEEYDDFLSNRTIDCAEALAGLVEITMGDRKLVFGDGINVRYFNPEEKLPKKHQLHIEFEDRSSLICTVQMYGSMMAFVDGEYDNPYYAVTKEKPNPLTDAFNRHYFEQLFSASKPTFSAKAFLATEQRIPGLGNGTLQDILFHARIHPKRKLNTLSNNDLDNLFDSVKNTLLEMTVKGGRDTEKDLFGCKGGYQTILCSKTIHEPCPVCGGFITKQAYLGGSIYYCPVCQPL